MNTEKLTQAIEKHFDYLDNQPGSDVTTKWLHVAEFTDFLAGGAKIGGRDRDRVERMIFAILDQMVEAGEVQSWLELHGPSQNPDRTFLYRRTPQ